jgi:hypothetical protein
MALRPRHESAQALILGDDADRGDNAANDHPHFGSRQPVSHRSLGYASSARSRHSGWL